MKVLIRQATIADPRSGLNGQKMDLLLEGNRILSIAPEIEVAVDKIIAQEGLLAAPGFTDIFAHFCDPGLEFKETLETGAAAAKTGGYTRVMVLPNTKPELYSKSQIEYVVQKSRNLPVVVHPIGAISRHCEGKELAEMHDMRTSGAVAFSDGLHPVQNSQVFLKALQYVKAMDATVIQIPDEEHLSKIGLMNEGLVSTKLGLPGKPMLAETLMLARDIELLRYTKSRLHVTGISTAASVELIRRAKNDGLRITASVTPYHLWFTEEDLHDYDTNLKVNPPIRTAKDTAALREALLDGTIDCVASHHQPHEWDSKVCEFEYAKYGMSGIETCVSTTITAVDSLSADDIARIFAIQPAEIFGLSLPVIEEGASLNMTLLARGGSHKTAGKSFYSKGSNNAFLEKVMKAVIIDAFCDQ